MNERKIIYLDDAVEAITQYLGRMNRDFESWEGTARIILDHVPSAQPSDEYDRGWKEGREALREETWEYVRDRLY